MLAQRRLTPLVDVDVDLGALAQGTIAIYADDDVEALARSFIQSHSLSPDVQLEGGHTLLEQLVSMLGGWSPHPCLREPWPIIVEWREPRLIIAVVAGVLCSANEKAAALGGGRSEHSESKSTDDVTPVLLHILRKARASHCCLWWCRPRCVDTVTELRRLLSLQR